MQTLQKLSLENMFHQLGSSEAATENVYFDHRLAVARQLDWSIPFVNIHTPFLLDDYRIGFLKRGTFKNVINLQEHTLTAGTAIFVTPGTIAELVEVSDDAEMTGIGIPSDLFHLVHHQALPPLFNGQRRDGMIKIEADKQALVQHMIELLFHLVKSEWASMEVVSHQIAAITYFYNDLFLNKPLEATPPNRQRLLFDKFIDLINHHCHEHRMLNFYASNLCVTERYLSTVIRQASGTTAKEWIDKAVITSAKVKLRHSHEQIVQIADELNFPTPSFFCKYFKRHVGCTPQAYRKGI